MKKKFIHTSRIATHRWLPPHDGYHHDCEIHRGICPAKYQG